MHELVQDYYGNQLQSTGDLRTSACCDSDGTPDWLKPLLARIHPEVLDRYYGCGLVCPELLSGRRVLDLGCGSGRDLYALAQLVGAGGRVVGVDMTEAQLAVARRHQDYHRTAFGYPETNTEFLLGYIERLDQLGLAPASFDLVVSNCVVNLSPDKGAVLRGAAELLKTGGEIYFSDVYADRRVPAAIRDDPVLYGECLGGALYWKDFLRLAQASGFADPRLVRDRPLTVREPDLADKLGPVKFFSATWRLFKVEGLEDAGEDYGQSVSYRGTIPGHPEHWRLDKQFSFTTGRPTPVCGNTWRLLAASRFADHFDFAGDFSQHLGIFPGRGWRMPFDQSLGIGVQTGCC